MHSTMMEALSNVAVAHDNAVFCLHMCAQQCCSAVALTKHLLHSQHYWLAVILSHQASPILGTANCCLDPAGVQLLAENFATWRCRLSALQQGVAVIIVCSMAT